MSEKSALFMARTTRFHEFARSLTTTLGVEVSLATPDSPTASAATASIRLPSGLTIAAVSPCW